jgi:hypothetical protein
MLCAIQSWDVAASEVPVSSTARRSCRCAPATASAFRDISRDSAGGQMNSNRNRSAAALAGILVGAFACEGEYRPYHPLGGSDASPVSAPQTSGPALNPAPTPAPQEMAAGEAAEQTSPISETPPKTPVANAPNLGPPTSGAPDAIADAGVDNAPSNCDCSGAPATPFCKTTGAGSPALLNTTQHLRGLLVERGLHRS